MIHSGYEIGADTWEGYFFANGDAKILTGHLKGPVDQVDAQRDLPEDLNKPIFLIFNMPSRHVASIDLLIGIASGHRDGDRGSVARLILLAKKDEKGNYKGAFSKEKLSAFFNYFSNRSRVRPPVGKNIQMVWLYEHLDVLVTEAKQREQELKKKKNPRR